MTNNYTEKDLDKILDDAFINSASFSKWFLSKTRFSDIDALYKWSRSDNPWGRFTFEITNSKDGTTESVTRDSETDILVVFEDKDQYRFALHIENKLANGHYTDYQPEFYTKRARAWLNNDKFGNYKDFETVLVAPIEFYEKNFQTSQHFDKFISYEEVGILLPEFSSYLEKYKTEKT